MMSTIVLTTDWMRTGCDPIFLWVAQELMVPMMLMKMTKKMKRTTKSVSKKEKKRMSRLWFDATTLVQRRIETEELWLQSNESPLAAGDRQPVDHSRQKSIDVDVAEIMAAAQIHAH